MSATDQACSCARPTAQYAVEKRMKTAGMNCLPTFRQTVSFQSRLHSSLSQYMHTF